MRDLTQEEIDNAPEWATHYYVHHNDLVSFNCCREGRLIFDITKHESECVFGIRIGEFDSSILEFDAADGHTTIGVSISKDDAIAFGKHYKLTAEDLKLTEEDLK